MFRISYIFIVHELLHREYIIKLYLKSYYIPLVHNIYFYLLPVSFFVFITKGIVTAKIIRTINVPKIIVIFKFFHCICFLKSVLFFLNTDACSLSWSDLIAISSAVSVF